MSVKRSSENKLTHAFLSFLFFSHCFIQIRFGLFDFSVFVLSSKYYLSKLMLLDFCFQKMSFPCKHNFCIEEKHTQWHWDTKAKAFHERISGFMKCPWNSISRNALKEKFHSVCFPYYLIIFFFSFLTATTFFLLHIFFYHYSKKKVLKNCMKVKKTLN